MLHHLRTSVNSTGPSFPDSAAKTNCLNNLQGRIAAQGVVIMAEVAAYDALISCHNYTLNCTVADGSGRDSFETGGPSAGPSNSGATVDDSAHGAPQGDSMEL